MPTPASDISWLPDEQREALVEFIEELERYCRGDRSVVSDRLALTLTMYNDDADELGRELVGELAEHDAGRRSSGESGPRSTKVRHDRRRAVRPSG